MKKEFLAVGIIALLLTIAFSGCVEENTVTAEEIKERFLQAVESVTSYRYSSDLAATMTTIKESETTTTEIVGVLTGEVDNFNKKLKQYNNITYTGRSNEEHMIFYFVDNTSYYGNETNGNITWRSSSYNPAVWDAYSLLEQLATILENGTAQFNNTELKRLSDETVENVDCYILQFTGFQNQSAGYNLTGYSYIEYEVNYWIAKDTNLLKKGYVKATSDSSGIYSFGGSNRSISVSELEIIFYDYNVPLNIELPSEAKNNGFISPMGDLSGTWEGSGTFTNNCENPACQYVGTMNPPSVILVLQQNGNNVFGTVTLNIPDSQVQTLISGQECTGFDNSVSDIYNGVLSGNRLTFADIGGNIWTLNFLNDNCQGTVGSNELGCTGLQGDVSLSRK